MNGSKRRCLCGVAFLSIGLGFYNFALTVRAQEETKPADLTTSSSTEVISHPNEDVSFDKTVLPFLRQYCVDCHEGEKPEGKFDISDYLSPESFSTRSKKWVRIISRIHNSEMPPVGSEGPSAEVREKIISVMRESLQAAVCSDGPMAGPAPMRRLNRTEYGATLRDLLGIQATLTQLLPEEGAGGEGFDNAAEILFLSPLHAEKYLEAARAALDYASKDPRSRDVIFSVAPPSDAPRGRRGEGGNQPKPPVTAESAKSILPRFLERAFRRPVMPEELESYWALYESAVKRGDSPEQAILFAMQGALVSPSFLFRIEQPNLDDEPKPINDFEMASRLSYFIWASMPDEELMRLAREGQLNNPETLKAQAARMLRNSRSREFAESFVEQWLGTRELGRNVKPDRKLNRYTNELEWALKQEPVLFFQYIVTENRPVLDLLDANYTFLDSKLERHYQLKIGGTNQQLKRFELPDDSHRGGLLGMAGVLAVTSLPHRTSPVLRGKWVRETILGSPAPPPPPNVPKLEESSEEAATPKSIRELLEKHRQNPVCASCHNAIDPIGFGLENYDLLGRWRTEDAGKPIDAVGELPDGTRFDGPQELKKALLARKDEFVRHLTSKLLGYALGRGLGIEDRCTVEEIADNVRKDNYQSHTLIAEIVCSVPFRYHRGASGNGVVRLPVIDSEAADK